jgi:ribosomal protein S18 acetylase RimI-like enzyme
MTQTALEWRVEEACLNAWPALREVLLDGWLLRFSDGLTRRGNSANPLHPLARLHRRECEALYSKLGLPTIFRLLSLIDASADERLAAAGYTNEGESCVLYGALDGVEAARDPDVALATQPTPEWFAAMARLQNHTAEQARSYQQIIGQIAIPAVFAALSSGGEIVALAYGAIHRGLLCYESVITDSSRRRRGFGRRIIAALAAWGKDNGAEGACLEIEAGNLPAIALYRAIGLKRELYRYHYRRQPRASAAPARPHLRMPVAKI